MRARHFPTSTRFWLRTWLVVAGAVLLTALASVGLSYAPTAVHIDPKASPEQAPNDSSALGTYLRSLRLMNYFPAGDGWQYMWTRWNPGQINADFATTAAMGARAVRITVFPGVTGFPVPTAVMRSRLSRIVSMASVHGLKVQLALFDQFTAFADISGSLTWARDLLGPLAGTSTSPSSTCATNSTGRRREDAPTSIAG